MPPHPTPERPEPPPRLRLGTRRSPLAMAQAEEARARLCAVHGLPTEAVALVSVVASGDKVQDRPLAEIGGKALWTRELDQWLIAGEIDAAVHSLKDVETIRPPAIALAAVLPRADVRDVLLGAETIRALPAGARVGTSSPRRAAQVLNARPDLAVVPFRGNVATRIAKLAAGEAEATLLAAAGLARLGESAVGTPLALERWLPAISQGAIGIECRADDDATRMLLEPIDHAPSRAAVEAERGLLAALGGSCHSPVAALGRTIDGVVAVRAALFSPDGAARVDGELTFAIGDAAGPRALARDLLARAPRLIRDHFAGPGAT